jgi:hypothetical protein
MHVVFRWYIILGHIPECTFGIMAGYRLDRKGHSLSPVKVKNFRFIILSRPALEHTQPPIQRILGALSPGIKQPGGEADHSPPNSASV